MPPPEQGQNQSTSMDFLWGAVALIAIVLAIWYFGREYILRGLFSLKLFEIYFIQFFTDEGIKLKHVFEAFHANPLQPMPGEINHWLKEVGYYLRIPVATILGGLAGYLYFVHPSLKFNTVFDMQRLREAEQDNWPQITPVIKENLIDQSIFEGKWAMAMSPMEFAKKNKLLFVDKAAELLVTTVGRNRPPLIASVKAEEANQCFAKQMGPIWQGDPEKLPRYMQALLATFLAKGLQDRKAVAVLLEQISRSSSVGKPNFSGAEALLQKHKDHKLVRPIFAKHAYIYGMMASALEFARTDGVFATADFLWLKPMDRSLWYMLNSTGRQTPYIEIAGPFAHWIAEKAVGRKLTQPMIMQATIALEAAIKNQIYVEDDADSKLELS